MGRPTANPILLTLALLAAVGVRADEAGQPAESPSGGSQSVPPEVQRRLDIAEQFLRRFDTNGDGRIEPGEVQGSRRQLFSRMAERAGLDASQTVSIEEFRAALLKKYNAPASASEGAGSAGADSAGARSSAPASTASGGFSPGSTAKPADDSGPKVPGFGVSQEMPKVPGFGSPESADQPGSGGGSSGRTWTSAGGSSTSDSGTDRSRAEYKYRRYAKSLVAQYDKNKDGVLDKEEAGQMHAFKDLAGSADTDKNGVISEDEVVARLMQYSKNRDSSGDSGSGSDDGDHGGRRGPGGPPSSRFGHSESAGSPSSHRFLTPTERLPKGLPDWFARKDADGDGQVTMAEYSSLWSDATARDFRKYDLNDDGVITPQECLEVESGD